MDWLKLFNKYNENTRDEIRVIVRTSDTVAEAYSRGFVLGSSKIFMYGFNSPTIIGGICAYLKSNDDGGSSTPGPQLMY